MKKWTPPIQDSNSIIFMFQKSTRRFPTEAINVLFALKFLAHLGEKDQNGIFSRNFGQLSVACKTENSDLIFWQHFFSFEEHLLG
jgi:hypothetical protein